MMLRVLSHGQLIGCRSPLTCCSFLPLHPANDTRLRRTLKVFRSCEVKPESLSAKQIFQSKNPLLFNSIKTLNRSLVEPRTLYQSKNALLHDSSNPLLQHSNVKVDLKQWTATNSQIKKLPKVYASLSKWYLTCKYRRTKVFL